MTDSLQIQSNHQSSPFSDLTLLISVTAEWSACEMSVLRPGFRIQRDERKKIILFWHVDVLLLLVSYSHNYKAINLSCYIFFEVNVTLLEAGNEYYWLFDSISNMKGLKG